MRNPIAAALALALVATNSSASAESDLRQRGTTVVRGKCYRLILNGRDLTSICRNKVTTVAYSDGTLSFLFSARNLTVGFLGNEAGIFLADGKIGMPVQLVVAGEGGDMLQEARASGFCRVGDMFAGPATIECSAQSVFGTMVASFISDGRRPRPS